jgi:hypothetical protein
MRRQDEVSEAMTDLIEAHTDFGVPEGASVTEYDVEMDDVQYFGANRRGLVVEATVIAPTGITMTDFRFRVDREDFNEAMGDARL